MSSHKIAINVATNSNDLYYGSVPGDLLFHNEVAGSGFAFCVNSNPIMTVSPSNSVIYSRFTGFGGKSNPTYPIDVLGDINFTGILRKDGEPLTLSQWGNSESNLFVLSSNVGIGTSNPQYRLDVDGIGNFSNVLVNGQSISAQINANLSNVIYATSNTVFTSLTTTGGTVNGELTINRINASINLFENESSMNIAYAPIAYNNIAVEMSNISVYNSNSIVTGSNDIFSTSNKAFTDLPLQGGTLTGTLNGTIINATTKLSQGGSNVYDLFSPISVSNIAYAALPKSGGTVNGNLSITGDLVVNGTSTLLNSSNVVIEDNIVTVNKNQTGIPNADLLSGIEVERGDASNYYFVYQESSGLFKVGLCNQLQAVMTRDDVMTSGYPYYDSSNYKLINKAIEISDVTGLTETLSNLSTTVNVVNQRVTDNLSSGDSKLTVDSNVNMLVNRDWNIVQGKEVFFPTQTVAISTSGLNTIATSVAIDSAANLYVAGTYGVSNNLRIVPTIYNSNGAISSLSLPNTSALSNLNNRAAFVICYNSNAVGQYDIAVDGVGNDSITSITVDSGRNLLVCGSYSNKSPILFNSTGIAANLPILPSPSNTAAFVVKYNSNGSALWTSSIDGANSDSANSIKTDTIDNVIVAGVINGGADTVRIHQMVQQDVEGFSSPTGLSDVSLFAGMGGAIYVNGLGTLAGFDGPRGIASDGTNFYVAESTGHRIRKISPSGVVTLVAGTGATGSANGTGSNASFSTPFGVAIDASRNVLYVTERTGHRIRRINLTNYSVDTFAGSGIAGGTNDVGTLASFNDPNGIAIDSSGNVYVVEFTGRRVRRIDVTNGQVTTIAGSGATGNTDGTGTSASFTSPTHIAIDSNNIAYVADYGGHRIRRIVLSTQAVTLLAGSGSAGLTNGTGSGAGFNNPSGVAVDTNFNVYVSEHGNHAIRRITPGGVVTTIAGTGTLGYVNAIGTAATLYWPDGMIFDNNYGLYFSDLGNHRIRRVEFPGVYTQVFAGNGNSANVNGKATISGFANPVGTGFDSKGNMYVACLGDHRIKRITANGDVSVFAGSGAASFADGLGTGAAFNMPHGLVVDMYDNIYVCDYTNQRIRKITPNGMVSTIAGTGITGSTDGIGTNASFNNPWGITVDSAGNLYVVNQGGHNIRKITPNLVVTTIAGTGNTGLLDGLGTAAGFNTPNAICCDRDGNLYVCDRTNYKIRRITPSGVVSTFAGSTNGGSGAVDGLGTNARFGIIRGIAIDKYNNLYVGDNTNFNIRKIDPSGRVSTIAGTGASGAIDGYNRSASFTDIYYLTVDNNGNLYISDSSVNTVRILSSSKEITTFAGSGTATLLNGYRLVAGFNRPHSIAIDSNGDMYVSEYVNNTIRKITSSTGIVTTFAGSGDTGSTDAVGTNASFNGPVGIAFDSNGNLYVADTGNRKIRKITPDGIVSTFAGSGASGTLDGTGTNATFAFPSGLAFDTNGNLFVSDQGNTRIRKITPEGVVSTFAITGQIESAGVAFDSSGNLYVADLKSHVVSKITPAAVVSILAGSAGSTGTADGLGTNARFNGPFGISIDKYDNIYVADKNNNLIRKITPQGAVTTLFGNGTSTFADGYGLNCSFIGPHGIYVYDNDIYIIDTNGHRIRETNIYSSFAYENVMAVSSNASFPSGSVLGGAAMAAVKYNSGGNPQWAVAVDGASNDRGTSVNVDSSGNIYLAGNYGKSAANVYKNASVVATLPATTSDLGAAVGIKLNSNGDFQWAVRVDGNCSNVACHIDGVANLYLCGSYSNSGALVVNASNSNVGSLPSVTNNSAFLVKYTSNGDFVWARTITGNNVFGYGVFADNVQNVFLCGAFSGPTIPTIYSSNNGISQVNMITPTGSNMMSYMVEYNSNGIPLQAYNMISSSNNMAYSIVGDTWGSNLYVGGSYQGTATIYDGNGNVAGISTTTAGLPTVTNESMYVMRHVTRPTPFYLDASLGASDIGKQKFVTNIGNSNIVVNLTNSNNQSVLSSGVISPGSNAVYNWLNPTWRRIV